MEPGIKNLWLRKLVHKKGQMDAFDQVNTVKSEDFNSGSYDLMQNFQMNLIG